MTLFVPGSNTNDRVQVRYGLILERSLDGYWMLSAQGLFNVQALGVVPMLLDGLTSQSVKALLAGANITLEDDGSGVVMIPATGDTSALEDALAAVDARVMTLEATRQVVRITNPDLGQPMHFVLVGSNITPLVAGPGVVLKTVPIDFPQFTPVYIRVSAPGVPALEGRVSA